MQHAKVPSVQTLSIVVWNWVSFLFSVCHLNGRARKVAAILVFRCKWLGSFTNQFIPYRKEVHSKSLHWPSDPIRGPVCSPNFCTTLSLVVHTQDITESCRDVKQQHHISREIVLHSSECIQLALVFNLKIQRTYYHHRICTVNHRNLKCVVVSLTCNIKGSFFHYLVCSFLV